MSIHRPTFDYQFEFSFPFWSEENSAQDKVQLWMPIFYSTEDVRCDTKHIRRMKQTDVFITLYFAII